MQSGQNIKKSNMPDHSELTMHLACSAFKMIGADEFVVNANLSIDDKESLRAFGLFESILLMAYKEGQNSAQTLPTERIKSVVTSMRDRATDNPQGIKAETLSMFADEIELAVKLQESVAELNCDESAQNATNALFRDALRAIANGVNDPVELASTALLSK